MRVVACVLLGVACARADIAGPDPVALRAARAGVVVVGTVTSIEDRSIPAIQYPGATMKVPFRVAVVKIDKGLLGSGGLTHIRVGFPETQNPRRPIQALAKEQQVLLYLKPHGDETFLVSSEYFYGFVYSTAPNFKQEVEEAEKTAKLLANPVASLKSTDKATRAEAAGLLVHRYTANRQPTSKRAAIDAEESTLILTALAEADWKAPASPRGYGLDPQTAFLRLGLTEADGWKPPQDFKQLPTHARKWLTDNAGTYRIQKVVPESR